MVVRTAVGPAPVTEDLALLEDDGALRTLVGRDVKGDTSEVEKALLRRPETVRRWQDALVALNKELETQFSERRAAAELKRQECLGRGPEGKGEWFAFRAQHEAWRAGAIRFKTKVEESLSECKRLVRQARPGRDAHAQGEELRIYRETLGALRGFLIDESASTPDHQATRRELLRLLDDALSEPARHRGPIRGTASE